MKIELRGIKSAGYLELIRSVICKYDISFLVFEYDLQIPCTVYPFIYRLFYYNHFFIFLSNFPLQWQICHLHPNVCIWHLLIFLLVCLENVTWLFHITYLICSYFCCTPHISYPWLYSCLPRNAGCYLMFIEFFNAY